MYILKEDLSIMIHHNVSVIYSTCTCTLSSNMCTCTCTHIIMPLCWRFTTKATLRLFGCFCTSKTLPQLLNSSVISLMVMSEPRCLTNSCAIGRGRAGEEEREEEREGGRARGRKKGREGGREREEGGRKRGREGGREREGGGREGEEGGREEEREGGEGGSVIHYKFWGTGTDGGIEGHGSARLWAKDRR